MKNQTSKRVFPLGDDLDAPPVSLSLPSAFAHSKWHTQLDEDARSLNAIRYAERSRKAKKNEAYRDARERAMRELATEPAYWN